jgi:hypothetical protein
VSPREHQGAPEGPARPALPTPDLRFFAARDVLLHEEEDPERVERLVDRLRDEGVLRNPPVVAELGDGRVVVLDGANRVTALDPDCTYAHGCGLRPLWLRLKEATEQVLQNTTLADLLPPFVATPAASAAEGRRPRPVL